MWSRLLAGFRFGAGALLDLIYPETCVFCGAEASDCAWTRSGPSAAGLSWLDRPHLCASCLTRLVVQPVRGELPDSGTSVVAACATGPDLVAAIKCWKYQGIRGLAWPLANLLSSAIEEAVRHHGQVDILVPIPLHKNRHRARGFNQAQMLAELARSGHAVMRPNVLRRQRSTGQQAKLTSDHDRRSNMLGAYSAKKPEPQEVALKIGVVDDLVTGGMTCEAAVSTLQEAGWQVGWVVCLGLALKKDANK